MRAIRFLKLLWRARVPWLGLVLDRALAFAPAADDVDCCVQSCFAFVVCNGVRKFE
jgi:hypothetical protein